MKTSPLITSALPARLAPLAERGGRYPISIPVRPAEPASSGWSTFQCSQRTTFARSFTHGRAQYDPYGNNISNSTWDGDGVGQPYGYTGARWDSLAGLYLMGARWYAPEMGRFVELDPIGEGGGWNLYNYVGSSPTMWVDPSGLRPEAGGGSLRQSAYRRELSGGLGFASPFALPGSQHIGLGWTPMYNPDKVAPCYSCSSTDDSTKSDKATAESQESGATQSNDDDGVEFGGSRSPNGHKNPDPSPQDQRKNADSLSPETADSIKRTVASAKEGDFKKETGTAVYSGTVTMQTIAVPGMPSVEVEFSGTFTVEVKPGTSASINLDIKPYVAMGLKLDSWTHSHTTGDTRPSGNGPGGFAGTGGDEKGYSDLKKDNGKQDFDAFIVSKTEVGKYDNLSYTRRWTMLE